MGNGAGEQIHRNSNGQIRQATGLAASNLDLYQVNCTFYDALRRNDRDNLLAGENDLALLAKSGVGRDINRHRYTSEEVELALQRPVVQSLIELMRFRNRHPAFNGAFSLPETKDSEIALRWDNGADWALLEVDLASGQRQISSSRLPGSLSQLSSNAII